MEHNTGIKTFIRIDDAIMDVIFPHVTLAGHVSGHWVYWMIPASDLPEGVQNWYRHQDPACAAYVRFKNFTFEEGLERTHQGDIAAYFTIGISLSTITKGQLKRILRNRRPFSIVEATIDPNGDYQPTGSSLLYTQAGKDFLYTPRIKSYPWDDKIYGMKAPAPELVQKFKESLKGHDFWYAYSDSASVYRIGEATTKRLKDAGVAMGLSREVVDLLYTEMYNELTKR